MVTYARLFKRAKGILKSRYDVDLIEDHWFKVEDWLCEQIGEILHVNAINKNQLLPQLEIIKRQNPTKFYLLEQDLIRELRRVGDKLGKVPIKEPIVRDISDKDTDNDSGIGGIKIKGKPGDNDDDDSFERDDRTGLIYR